MGPLFKLGFGFVEVGTVTPLKQYGNKKLGILGVNVGPNKDSNDRMNDYLIGLEKFSEVADYITINISSPNTENLRNFHEENKLKELLVSISEKKKQLKKKS